MGPGQGAAWGPLGFGAFMCCQLAHLAGAVLKIDGAQSDIYALLEENVSLPCVVTDDEQPQLDLDLRTAAVRWEVKLLDGSDRRVYQLINNVPTSYRAGAHVEISEFKRGFANLRMSDVQISDEGEYRCIVFVTPNKVMTTITLRVLAKPSIRLTSYNLTVETGHERSLTCEVSKFYPKSIAIQWFKYDRGSAKRSALDREVRFAENNDGTFNGSCLILVHASSMEDNGNVYSCVVNHISLSSDVTLNSTLTVEETWNFPVITVAITVVFVVVVAVVIIAAILVCVRKEPKLSDIFGAENMVHLKESTLTCMISQFKPNTIRINLYVKRNDDSERQLILSQEYPPPSSEEAIRYNRVYEGVASHPPSTDCVPDTLQTELEPLKPKWSILGYDCPCVFHVTPDIEIDDGAELTLEVEHPALQSPKSASCKLKISGDFLTLSPLIAPPNLIHGEDVTLSCRMTMFTKKSLHILWLKEDLAKRKLTKIIYEQGKATEQGKTAEQYTHEFKELTNKPERCYQCSSSLKFKINAKEDHEKKYICMVHDPESNLMKKTELNTFVTAKPKVEAITSKHAVHSVGQVVELTCRIESFLPEEIRITWQTEGRDLPPPDNDLHLGENGLFSAASVLKYIPQIEDIGRRFTCSVDHQSFKYPKSVEWTLKDLTLA